MTDVILDVTRMELDEHGVQGFSWPVTREEIVAMRDETVVHMVAAARGTGGSNDEYADMLRIVFGPFLNEAMRLYRDYSVVRRLTAEGNRPIAPQRNLLMTALVTGETLPPSPLINDLIRGWPSSRRFGRSNYFGIRTNLRWNGLSLNIMLPYDRERDIVAIQRLWLIDSHARSVPEFVRFVDRTQWFGPLDGRSAGNSTEVPSHCSTIEQAIKAVQSGFTVGNEDLPDHIEHWLRDWLVQTMSLTSRRLAAILNNPEQVPRELWTGNGGGVWNRILRHATQRVGGTVTGHDHTPAEAYRVTEIPTLFEFESSDTYVTFTPGHAKALQKGLRDDLLIPPKPPAIVALPPNRDGSIPVHAAGGATPRPLTTTLASEIRTVMYPSMFYGGGMLHFLPLLPDIVQVDWQARLLAHIRSWGYEILLKPHPGSRMPTPAALANQTGIMTLTERFEAVLDAADLFIFDSPVSNIFGTALATNKPVVLIDYGRVQFVPEASAALRKRCAIVPAWHDAANRLQVDWDELHGAIHASCDLMDPEFVDNYLVFARR